MSTFAPFRLSRSWVLGLLAVLVAGCGSPSPSTSRYAVEHDSGPTVDFDMTNIPEVELRYEARGMSGNFSPYTVMGNDYEVLPDSKGYEAEGIASWYGNKFHGHKTSNGETYNMFTLSAAHRELPLPTFVRVENLDNGREAIVRVNDRGPFHDERLIDLSWAAAVKLGFAEQGTARVRIEAIEIEPPADYVGTVNGEALFLQAGAFSNRAAADSLAKMLEELTTEAVGISSTRSDKPELHRVRVGPLLDYFTGVRLKESLTDAGMDDLLLVRQTVVASTEVEKLPAATDAESSAPLNPNPLQNDLGESL